MKKLLAFLQLVITTFHKPAPDSEAGTLNIVERVQALIAGLLAALSAGSVLAVAAWVSAYVVPFLPASLAGPVGLLIESVPTLIAAFGALVALVKYIRAKISHQDPAVTKLKADFAAWASNVRTLTAASSTRVELPATANSRAFDPFAKADVPAEPIPAPFVD